MKRFIKRTLAVVLAGVFAISSAACSDNSGASTSSSSSGNKYKIGVIQYASHGSLDNCYTGFIKGLEEAGLKDKVEIDFQNAQGDMQNSDLQAKNMVTSKYDLITAIATPAALSAYSAAQGTDIPVVFTAVSDPLASGIVQSLEKPGSNCTGTADVLNFDKQLEMIRDFLPEGKTIGILYTTSEDNSVSHLREFEKLAPKYGFEVEAIGVTNSSEVASAAATLVSKGVDCINNFTDNNVVNNLSSVLNAANKTGIPVFGSEIEQVNNGCLAAQSIDYVELGRQTGLMAAKILTGEQEASSIPVSTITVCTPVYNSQVAKDLGITVPDSFTDAEDVAGSN